MKSEVDFGIKMSLDHTVNAQDCHVYCSQSLVVIFICHFFFLYLVLIEDVNANPNKRQRQPALLGDHPPEYGKALSHTQLLPVLVYTKNYIFRL